MVTSRPHLIGYDARYKAAVQLIDRELDLYAATVVLRRKEAVLKAAQQAYGSSPDYRAIRQAWEDVFPQDVYSKEGLQRAVKQAGIA